MSQLAQVVLNEDEGQGTGVCLLVASFNGVASSASPEENIVFSRDVDIEEIKTRLLQLDWSKVGQDELFISHPDYDGLISVNIPEPTSSVS